MSTTTVTNPPINTPNNDENYSNTLNDTFIGGVSVLHTAVVAAAVVVLILSMKEVPKVPLRLWIVVYVVLYSVQISMGFIINLFYPNLGFDGILLINGISEKTKRIVMMYFAVYCIWVLIGLYWVASGGQMLADDAPKLYWLSVIFLAINIVNVVNPVVVEFYDAIQESRKTFNQVEKFV